MLAVSWMMNTNIYKIIYRCRLERSLRGGSRIEPDWLDSFGQGWRNQRQDGGDRPRAKGSVQVSRPGEGMLEATTHSTSIL